MFSIGGNPLWPINSALRILWMAENEPEIYRRTDKWLLIEDFLNFMLCGRQVTDYSMASCTLLFDQRTRRLVGRAARAVGHRSPICCARCSPAARRWARCTPRRRDATGLAEGTPVVLGGHDHLCGALPVGAFRPGVVLDVTGTWETVITATGRAGARATSCAVRA